MSWETYGRDRDTWEKLLDISNPNRFIRYFWEAVNTSSSVLAIILFLIAAFRSNHPEFWYVLILFAYLFVVVVCLIIQYHMYGRKARYAEAIRIFHPIAHIFRDSMYNIEQISEDEFKQILDKILSALVSGFEIVTGTKIRACIKLLKVEGGFDRLKTIEESKRPEIIYVEMIASNPATWISKKYSDYPYDKDRLSCNSAFRSILIGDVPCYFSNNLPREYKRHLYENSSFTAYGEGHVGKPGWVLPYRSTILWPIRKLQSKTKQESSSLHRSAIIEKHDLLGFLCVDSSSRNVWSSRFDIETGAAIADFLYTFMDNWFIHHLSSTHPADTSLKSE